VSAIDLGDITAGPPEVPEPPMTSRALRRATLALVTVLSVATVSASTRPEPSRLVHPMWSIATTDLSPFYLDHDTVFVLANGWDLTAYALADGRVRWSKRLTEPQLNATAGDMPALLLPSGHTVITTVGPDGQRTLDNVTAATVALDPVTGAQRWRIPGDIAQHSAEAALLVEPDPHSGRPRTFREVRIGDGAVMWARAAGSPDYWAAGGDEIHSGHLVTTAADGRTEVFRLVDGRRTAAGRLPLHRGRRQIGDSIMLEVDPAAMYLNRTEGGRLTVAAYDLATLRPRWTVDGGTTARQAHLCGPALCVSDGSATTGYDLGTGRFRWRAEGWINAVRVTGGRLLADSTRGSGQGLLDATTGRLMANLGDGNTVWDALAGVPTFRLRDTLSPPGRTAVTRLDARTGTRWLRGMIDAVPGKTCAAEGDRLICLTTNGRLAVTSVR
jgi:outer membrane protein assembly factor BamB